MWRRDDYPVWMRVLGAIKGVLIVVALLGLGAYYVTHGNRGGVGFGIVLLLLALLLAFALLRPMIRWLGRRG